MDSLLMAPLLMIARFINIMGWPHGAAWIYHHLLRRGSERARFRLGELYWDGYKFPRDMQQGALLIEAAEAAGDSGAIKMARELRAKGLLPVPPELQKLTDRIEALLNKEKHIRRSSRWIWQAVFFGSAVLVALILTLG